jgi:hypothetical protein
MSATLLLALSSAHAATLQVGPTRAITDLQVAIDGAQPGDVVEIDAGVYQGPFVIDDTELTLTALGAVELQASDASVLRVDDAVATLVGLTVRADGGRGIRVADSIVTMDDVDVSGNNGGSQPYNGAAVGIFGGSVVTIRNSTFADNETRPAFSAQVSSGWGGHIYVDDADLSVFDSTFRNGAATLGGAILHGGSGALLVEGCTFEDHDATDRGGALWTGDAVSVDLRDSSFLRSTTPGNGGALRVEGGAQPAISLTRVTMSGGSADFGGAIAINTSGALTITGSTFEGNDAEHGGALSVFRSGTLSLTDSTFCGNGSDEEGGAVRLNEVGEGTWANVTLIENGAGAPGGGALYVEDSGPQDVDFLDVIGNTTTGTGSGLRVIATDLQLDNTLVAFNAGSVALSSTDGGALTNDHNGWFANAGGNTTGTPGPNAVTDGPQLVAFARNGRCDDDTARRATSPLIDAADPALSDPDGSRADIGALGGPGAIAAFADNDGDGTPAAFDCDDTDDTVFPGATEVCDSVDNDCDGDVDGASATGAEPWYPDVDGDGFGDADAAVLACVAPDDTYGNDDRDCDDADAAINPDADETCDGIDNDCDGDVDGSNAIDPGTWFLDEDGDGFGTDSSTIAACEQPNGYAQAATDCDDADADVNPVADEVCDDKDNDCDGGVDVDAVDQRTWWQDRNGDGFGGADSETVASCDPPDGFRPTGDDCDDLDAEIRPGALESCDPPFADRNCDGFVGDVDNDGDGFPACEDCDDADPLVYPGAPELWYDGRVRDCSSLSDFDADRDGFDSIDFGGEDCDDAKASVNPEARERPDNGVDDDCDGDVDEVGAGVGDLALGCTGCSSGSPSAAWWSLLLLLVARRRR